MSTWEAVFAAIVILCAVVAWRNWTVVAMVASWGVLQAAWLMTREWSPMLELICDYAVLIAIFVKEERDCDPYKSVWHQLACIVTRRSPCDRVVMLLFPLMWVLYVSPVDPYYRWWGLWWLSAIQYLAAGYEGLGPTLAGYWTWLKSFNETPPRVMRLGLAGGG